MSANAIPTFLFRALRFQDPDKEALHQITDVEWERILSNWSTARIMMSFRLDVGEDLPNWVRQRIDQNLADIAMRFQKIKSAYATVATELRGVCTDHLVIKGFSLFPGYTDRPDLRPQGDIDLYCPPESIFRAQQVLSTLGYLPNLNQLKGDHLSTMMPKGFWRPGPNIFDVDMPICFELHFCFWNEKALRFRVAGLDRFWSRRIKRQIDGLWFPSLHPVDNLGYTALNVLRDLLLGHPSPEQVHGVARFLHTQANDIEFWHSWQELHEPSLRRLEAISFRLAKNWFACKVAEDVQNEMDLLPAAIQDWFRETSESGLYPRFGQMKDGAWLHVLLLESFADKVGALRRALFGFGVPPQADVSSSSDRQSTNEKAGWKLPYSFRRSLTYSTWVVTRAAVRIARFPSFFRLGFRLWFSRLSLSKDFWSFFAGSFFVDLGMYIFFVLYNLYLLDRGFKENVLGLIASASAIGGIAGTIPAGLMARRIGLRKALLLCLMLVPVIFAFRLLVSSEILLLVLAFLGGLVMTIWAVCISPAIAQLTNEQSRPIGFSTVFSSGIAVGILGGQAGGRLPGWLETIAPVATAGRTKQVALLIACGLVALATLPISRIKFNATPTKERKVYPANRFLVRYLSAIAVWTLAIGAFDPFFNTYFSQYLHMPLQAIGSVYSYAHLSQVLAIMVSPLVFRRFGIVNGIVYVQIGAAIALGALASCSRAPAAAVVYIGYMALQWMTDPGMMLLLMNKVAPEERTRASALNFLVINLSGAAATAVAGASFTKFGYPLVLMVTSLVGLVGAFFFWLMLGDEERIPDFSSH